MNKISIAILMSLFAAHAVAKDVRNHVDSTGVIDCPSFANPVQGKRAPLQAAHSGIYRSEGLDGTAFDLSIQPTGMHGISEIYVTVREADGQWFEGREYIGNNDHGLFIALFEPGSEDVVRYMTLCTTHLARSCSQLDAAVWRQDGLPNTTPLLTPFSGWRMHGTAQCVR